MPKGTVESFAHQQESESLNESFDLGLRTVEVQNIVGSVNRWRDFDNRFRVRNPSTLGRYQKIKRIMQEGEHLPPVELYKVRDKYYVVDGNHRVAAAKSVGQVYIDGYVKEYLPPPDSVEHLLWRERSTFERRTGLSSIRFTDLGQYQWLLSQIEKYHAERKEIESDTSLTDAARQWFQEIYLPLTKHIAAEKLLKEFPGRSEADLFLYATYHRTAKARLTGEDISYTEAIKDLHPEARKPLSEKIVDTISGLFSAALERQECPYGVLIDEDGLVHVVRHCNGCTKCRTQVSKQARVISDDDITRYIG